MFISDFILLLLVLLSVISSELVLKDAHGKEES